MVNGGRFHNNKASGMLRWLLGLGSCMLLVIGYVELVYLPQKQDIDEHHDEIASLRRELDNLRSTPYARRQQQANNAEHELLRHRINFLETLVRKFEPEAATEMDEFRAAWSTTTTSLSLPSTASAISAVQDEDEFATYGGSSRRSQDSSYWQSGGGVSGVARYVGEPDPNSQIEEKARYSGGVSRPKANAPPWRRDYKCGTQVPGSKGILIGCNPESDSPCCSQGGWCGSSSQHCFCQGCIDYRPQRPSVRDRRHYEEYEHSYSQGDAAAASASYREDTPKSIAIVIPFRDRGSHLEKFRAKVEAMVEYWNKKNVKHTWMVFIVEQFDNELFNRGWLFNVGYKYAADYSASKGFTFDCVVMHDVDILPTQTVDYGWCVWPNQLSGEIDCWGNSVPYEDSTGGVLALSPKHWQQINGFSNEYHGWGGEDDDLYLRMRQNRMLRGNCHTFCSDPRAKHIPMVHRPPLGKGRFTCVSDGEHTPRVRNTDDTDMWKRLNAMRSHSKVWQKDGISSVSMQTAGLPLQSSACDTECEAPEDPKPRRRLYGEHWSRVSRRPIAEVKRIRVLLPPNHTCDTEAPSLSTIPVGLRHLRRLLPDLFDKSCGVTEEWALKQNFVLIDAELGQAILVGVGAPVVPPDAALPRIKNKGEAPSKPPELDSEFVVQSQRLSQWIRRLPADHHGWIVVANAPLATLSDQLIKKDRRHPLIVPVCVASAMLDGVGGRKFRLTPGSQWCGDGGWTSAEYFNVLRSKYSIAEDKLIPMCIGYNKQIHTYRFEKSETACVGTHERSGTEWEHVGTVHSSKDAIGDEVCVGVAHQGTYTRWMVRKAPDCNADGYTHSFSFREMRPRFQPPIIRTCLLTAKHNEAQHKLTQMFAGDECHSGHGAAVGYTEWWLAKTPTLLATRQSKTDKRLCFATATVRDRRNSNPGWRLLQDKSCDMMQHSTVEEVADGQIGVTWNVHTTPRIYSPVDASGTLLCVCRAADGSSLSERLLYSVSVMKCEPPRSVQEFCFRALSGMDLVKAAYLLDEPA